MRIILLLILCYGFVKINNEKVNLNYTGKEKDLRN